ncbi:MAG: thiolase family protein [Acidimicrobiia bacterium]|nr:thiolase family protein [Acidimicrobiia bacterium]
MRVEIAGTGLHTFGRHPETSLAQLGATAVRAALEAADVGRGDFQAAYCGTAYGGVASGHRVLGALGLTGGPIVDVEAGCASGAAALQLAAGAIEAGRYERVLVFGVERMPKGMIRSSFFEPWVEEAGLSPAPAYFALRAQRLMRETGLTKQDLAAVVVKNRANGVLNPDAMFRKAVTPEEVLASRVVCDPLHLWMLCSPNDGAAAVVLERGRGRGVEVAAVSLRSHLPGSVLGEATPLSGIPDDDITPPTALAAAEAYEKAGLGPEDLDLVECQDTDAARELLACAEIGLCPVGELPRWVHEGAGLPHGRLPVNTSGGLLSKGEPLGASALGQVVEIVAQLRGEAGPRQVPGASVGLAHTIGRGANASVTILKAPARP